MDPLLELSDLICEVTKEKLDIYFKEFELEQDEHPHCPMEIASAFMEELYDEMFEDDDEEWNDDEE